MKKFFSSVLIAASLLGLFPFSAVAADTQYGIVQGGSLRMRSGPSSESSIITSYPTDTWVQILGEESGFYKVIANDGRQGYMMAQYIIGDQLQAGDWGTVANGTRYVNLRTGPATTYPSIGKYYTGDRFELVSYGDIFSKVRFDGQVVGYMSSGLIRLDGQTTWQEDNIHTYQGGKLNLRSGPSLDAQVLGSYPQGTEVIVLVAGNVWDKVFVEGSFGYMDNEYLVPKGTTYQNVQPFAAADAVVSADAVSADSPQDTTVDDNEDFIPDTTVVNGEDIPEGEADG